MEQSTKLLLPHPGHMWALAFSNIIACSFIGELANLQLQINNDTMQIPTYSRGRGSRVLD